jgi:hypothetical protein
LWGNREAAKKAFQRGQMGTFPYKDTIIRDCPHLVRLEYRRDLSRHGAVVAWCDLDLVPDPTAWLSERVGPLAWCAVGDKPLALRGDDVATAEPEGAGGPSGAADETCPDPLQAIPSAPAIAAMPDADKLAMRARLQAGRVAAPDGVAAEVPGGYGEGLEPDALFPGVDGVTAPDLDPGGATVGSHSVVRHL